MKTYLITIVAILSLPVLAQDADRRLTLRSGKVFEEVTITKATNYELRFIHKTGTAAVSLADVSDELQKRFGYDPQAEEKARAERMAEQEAAAQKAAEERKERLEQENAAAAQTKAKKVIVGAGIAVIFTIQQSGPASLGHARLIQRVKTSLEAEKLVTGSSSGLIAMVGLNHLADGERWTGIMYPCGTYRYDSVGGDYKTVRKFAVSVALAEEELMKAKPE
jgi:hypothetical protein